MSPTSRSGWKAGLSKQASQASVLIVDRQPLFRLGLVGLVESETELRVCDEVESAEAALEAIRKKGPDLVILDLALEDTGGLEFLKDLKIRYPDLPCLVLTHRDESYYAERAIRAGALGFLMKDAPVQQVRWAIEQVRLGKMALSDRMTSSILEGIAGGKRKRQGLELDRLSDREFQTFEMIGQGLSTREIAAKLILSVKTVENYREHIKTKLDLKKGVDLVRCAIQWSLEEQS